MMRRLTLFSVTSIAACVALWLAVRLFLSDVAPTTWGEEPAPFWRLETAVLLVTLQWITGVVGGLAAVGVIVLQFNRLSRRSAPER
jgi:hypothetical protein